MDMTPADLVRRGFCDPVRLFVKQEPHTRKKLSEGRFRLISSVSLVDQLVERMLFGPQNRLEIASWKVIPSKPGMGLSLDSQARAVWADVAVKATQSPAAEADISGFDWSVQDWELWTDVEMRIKLSGALPKLANAMRARFYCFMNSVFQLSNGEMYAQLLPGLMKSGSYCTSSTNSRIRCLMAELIGSPWCIAMGDDSVEAFVPNAQKKYYELGHSCKDYIACRVDELGRLSEFNFCSHLISRKLSYLVPWPKTLYRHLASENETWDDIASELVGNPRWPEINRYLLSTVRESASPDKTIKDAAKEDSVDSSGASSADQGHFRNECAAYSEPQAQEAQSPEYYCGHEFGASCYDCRARLQTAAYEWWGWNHYSDA